MIEPSAASTSAACVQAESSKKRNAIAKPASKSKRQSTISKSLLVPRNSTTFLSISKKGLPAPSTSKAHAKLVDPADSNWVVKQFVDFVIVVHMIKFLAQNEISITCEDAPELIEEENASGSSDSEHDLDMEQVTEWNAVVF